jgi:hypothetical protein
MELPSLCHFRNEGIYHISSDPVEVLIGEAWVPAKYTDKGWASADGATLLSGIEEWRHYGKEEAGQGSEGDGGVQARDAAYGQTGPRQGSNRQKQKAGDCDSIKRSRQGTQNS